MYRALNAGAVGVGAPFEEAARLARENGFEGIYLDGGYVMERGGERVREFLEGVGLRAACFGFPVSVAGTDEEYERGLGTLESVAPQMELAGCSRTSTYIPSWHDSMSFEENFEFHRERLVRPATLLKDHGIRLGLEFLGPKSLREGKRYEFIHTLEGMLELCEAIGTGNVGLLLDCWHWYTSGHDPADLEKLTDDGVVDVHVNDAPSDVPPDRVLDLNRRLPGETGVIDVGAFLRALDAAGYTGPVMAEPMSDELRTMPDEESVRVVAEHMEKIWREAGLSV